MRRYGLYDATRGLTTAIAAGAAGALLWVATQVGQQTTGRFWAEMGIVAVAGLVLVLIVAGWILMATQPGTGWHEGRVASWSGSIGVMGVVHALGLWHGVL